MNYYERHLGDYAKDTGHLSLLEHGVYTLLLDRYYSTEQGIPADQAYRLARARTDEERAAVDSVLGEFFALSDGVWINCRADEEIDRYTAKQDAARANGKKGGRPRKSPPAETKQKAEITQPFPPAFENETQTKAHQSPDTSNQSRAEPKALVQRSAARFAEFWDAYPVKKGKAAAEKAWRSKGCDAIADQVIEHVRLMQAHDDDWRRGYVPHGSTYVNGERWQDQPKQSTPQPGQQGQQSKTLSVIQRLEGMKNGLADPRTDDRLPKVTLLGTGPHAGDRLDRGDGHGLGGSGPARSLVG